MHLEQSELRAAIHRCLVEALLQVGSGSFVDDDDFRHVQACALSSISFTTNKKNEGSTGGKPHDIEIRVALSLYHRLSKKLDKECTSSQLSSIELISDLGLSRQLQSPADLAKILQMPLETACRREGIAHYVRFQPSGIICIVTVGRAQILRKGGKLPCNHCTKWCQGEKGLWWHQQQNHHIEYAEAIAVAASSIDTLAIVPYNPINHDINASCVEVLGNLSKGRQTLDESNPMELVKEGRLEGLKLAVETGYKPAEDMDHRGASPLMWAAGGGRLDMVQYLVEQCDCDPELPQKGKRSFAGRTALHWAARNGHIQVVRYLVTDCRVNLEAATMDGTTAFCWASWQGHRDVMEFLHQSGCNIHAENTFGCNAVLWSAQGKTVDVDIMEWLHSKGCDMTKVNRNGHGVLHKAAQRGQTNMCTWFFEKWIFGGTKVETALRLVAPDIDGYCPSDLAGAEGHEELAITLCSLEMKLMEDMKLDSTILPPWLRDVGKGMSDRLLENQLHAWERYGGTRRMRSKLSSRQIR